MIDSCGAGHVRLRCPLTRPLLTQPRFPPRRTMTRVEELRQLSDLAPYRLRWRRLLGETRDASYLQSLDWLETFLKHAGEDVGLKVLSISHGRQALGILPLVVARRRTGLGIVRQLTYPVLSDGSCYGPLGPHPTATLTAGLRHLSHGSRDWDLLNLNGVNTGTDRGRTEHALRRAGFRPTRRMQATKAIVDFSGSWQDYLASRSPQWLPEVRRAENRLNRLGDWEHVHYRPEGSARGDDDPRWDLYQSCERIAAGSGPGDGRACRDGGLGGTGSEAGQAFRQDVHEQAAASGNVDLHLLRIERRTVAFVYGFHLHGRGLARRWGVDRGLPSESAQAAMSVLWARCLESCCRAGDRSYDLGIGWLPGGCDWPTRHTATESYTHYASGPRSLLLRLTNMVHNWRQRGAPQVALE